MILWNEIKWIVRLMQSKSNLIACGLKSVIQTFQSIFNTSSSLRRRNACDIGVDSSGDEMALFIKGCF